MLCGCCFKVEVEDNLYTICRACRKMHADELADLGVVDVSSDVQVCANCEHGTVDSQGAYCSKHTVYPTTLSQCKDWEGDHVCHDTLKTVGLGEEFILVSDGQVYLALGYDLETLAYNRIVENDNGVASSLPGDTPVIKLPCE